MVKAFHTRAPFVWLIFLVVLSAGCPKLDGFATHIEEAIELNTERRALYAADSGGQSNALFNKLITYETLLIPVARVIDIQARSWVEDGVYVVVNDFVPMDSGKSYGAPIKSVAPMSEADVDDAKDIVDELLDESIYGIFPLVDAAYIALHNLEKAEDDKGMYFSMTKHAIESVAFAALHGLYYNCETNGGTRFLVSELVGVQLLGLALFDVTDFDVLANPLHVAGHGVLVNELPPIPFMAEYEYFNEVDRSYLSACLN